MLLPNINTPINSHELPFMVTTLCRRKRDKEHVHSYAQICYVLAGTLKYTYNGEVREHGPGSCRITLPYIPHALDTSDSEDTPVVATISFTDNFLIDRNYRFFSYSNRHARFEEHLIPSAYEFSGEEREAANKLVRAMSAEFELHKKMSLDKIADLLAKLLRMVCREPANDANLRLMKERANGITESIKYMSKHFSEKITIEELCSVAAMSNSMYAENFKAITGTTPIQFLLGIRLAHARFLLLSTDMSLNEIAHKVGLYDKSRLTHTFTSAFGMSPQTFRDTATEGARESIYTGNRRWAWLNEGRDDGEKE